MQQTEIKHVAGTVLTVLRNGGIKLSSSNDYWDVSKFAPETPWPPTKGQAIEADYQDSGDGRHYIISWREVNTRGEQTSGRPQSPQPPPPPRTAALADDRPIITRLAVLRDAVALYGHITRERGLEPTACEAIGSVTEIFTSLLALATNADSRTEDDLPWE